MKKFLSISALILICFTILFAGCSREETIGTISGAEYQYLTIGEQEYVVDYNATVQGNEKDKYIGKVKSGDMTFKIYSIKNTDEYLYCRWEWEGRIYKIKK